MANNNLDEFTNMIKGQNSDIPMLEYHVKDIHSICGVVLTVIDTGFLSNMMTVINLWSQKHNNATIKISYQSTMGEQIEVTYNNLNQKDTVEILSNHPPQIGGKVKLELPPFD
jgi:hypothetical protein